VKPSDLGLRSPSFVSTESEISRRFIVNIEGLQKCGKTTFALTAPDPIVVLNVDRSLEGIVQAARKKGKKIIVAGMPGSDAKGGFPHYGFIKPPIPKGLTEKKKEYTSEVKKIAAPIWERFVQDYYEALRSKARTVVADTGTGFWLLARYARWGGVSPGDPRLAGTISADFASLVQNAQDFDKNVIWLHRLRAEYKNNEKTGELERSGHPELGFDVHANVRLSKVTDRRRGKKRTHYQCQVLDCRLNSDVNGLVLEDDFSAFPYLASSVFGSDPDEWE
jgi:hypothetical protein